MNIGLAVTGCIAAYKAIEVMRALQKSGVSVEVILTRAARKFVTPLTFEALSGHEVITGMFRPGANTRIQHIEVAQRIQLLAVVPATADILGKFARGIADDFLTTLYLSTPARVLLAPAMNVEMWNNPAVQENVQILTSRGHEFVNPEPGELACGMEGEGRLAEIGAITSRILDLLANVRSMSGLKVLVTAGPTIEDIDPVRFISNRSSGKMGLAMATAARLRGATVFLISGPTHLSPPSGVQLIYVRSAKEMKDATLRLYPEMDIVIKAAAVSDYSPAEYRPHKVKKESGTAAVALVRTEDILALLGASKKQQILVGFAAETEDVVSRAREKMQKKNLDLIVANDISTGIFGEDTATVHILTSNGDSESLPLQSKLSIANRVLDLVQAEMAARKIQRIPG